MPEERNRSHALLNEHQHRALSTRLGLLDRQLYQCERILRGELPKSEMFEMTSDLTAEDSRVLLELTNEARNIIRLLRERFDLAVEHQNARRWILGHFSVLWAVLEDCRAAKLEGFGEVSPGLAPALDPDLNEVIGILNRIKSQVTL
jgi:hypothetical protein